MTNEIREPLQPEEETGSQSASGGKQGKGALISKNIRIHDRRTSVRLEPEMWDALAEIAEMEDCSIHDLCGAVHDLKEKEVSFTGALRVFLMEYYRAAARSNRQISQVQKKLMTAKNK
jgi:predicted DNA-binding ribbon-helix-helix protein